MLNVTLNDNCNDELLETINIPKSQGPRQSQNCRSSDNGQDVGTDSSNDLFLKEGLARLDRDIMTMKGENAQDIDNIDKRIRDMIKENETLKDVVKKQADKIYRLQNSIDKSDSALVEFMAEIRCEIKTLTDENHQTKQNSQNLIEVKKDISEIDTVISSLATETGNNSTKIQSVKEDINALKISEKSVDSRITRLEDSKFSGVDALRANLKLVRKDIYDLNDEIDTVKSDIKVNNRSISDLHKSGDMKKTKTKTKNYPKSPKISTDSDIDLISFVSPKRLSKFQMAELTDKEQRKSTTEHQYRGKKDIVTDNSTNIDTVIDDSSMSEFSSFEMSKTIENHGKKQTQNQFSPEHIEVVISSDQNMVSLNNFRGVSDKRVERLYVGGIRKDCTESDMRAFLLENNVKFTYIRFFTKGLYSNSAQLNVRHSEKERVYDSNFWPDGIFFKRWLSRRQLQERTSYKNEKYGN
ncbi:unnamed protein product [Mytilus edulis]|uniref:Uncharacterized protein n=1 Tax=Mytilus edulis TaxID=6550 RepID=A0A8S3R8N8_MYTED|nr:unnamed protein product [Mytilus edulis]